LTQRPFAVIITTMAARITPEDYRELLRLTEAARSRTAEYLRVKAGSKIPSVADASLTAAREARAHLHRIFIQHQFNLLDVIVAERGHGPVSDSDTHFRGRALELALNGTFNGLSEPDYKYGDLKLIEIVRDYVLAQVMTCGVIFAAEDKETGVYIEEQDYFRSNFYKKMRQAIILGYQKRSRQLGVEVRHVILFQADDPLWAEELKADWLSIRDEMTVAIAEFRAGKRIRRSSGICRSDTSGKRRPNGYLGIRSDSVVFTKKFFELMARHYAGNN
jgi:hypothetical protein